MKKRLTGFLTASALLLGAGTAANAYTPEQERAADALNELGMFLGTGTGYELDNELNRVQGITLLVRLMGLEDAALSGTYETPFTDVPEWAAGYVGYAYENGITNGIGAQTFGSEDTMTDCMFLTLVLRALGYTDSGENAQFVWNDPYALAERAELISAAEADGQFTRGDAVVIFWNAMDAELVGTEITLKDSLIAQGVIREEVYIEAEDIGENGRKENPGVPVVPPKFDITEEDTEPDMGEKEPSDTGNDDPVVPDTGNDDPVVPDTGNDDPVVPDTGNDDPVVPDTGFEEEIILPENEDQLPMG